MDPFQAVTNFLKSPVVILTFRVLQLTFVASWLSLVVWTFRDARRRGSLAPFWAVTSLLIPFIGTMIYFFVRPPEYLKDVQERELEIQTRQRELARNSLHCPSCKNPVERDFMICPYCLKNLKKPCSNCGKTLDMSWNACPYCGDLQELKIRLGGTFGGSE